MCTSLSKLYDGAQTRQERTSRSSSRVQAARDFSTFCAKGDGQQTLSFWTRSKETEGPIFLLTRGLLNC